MCFINNLFINTYPNGRALLHNQAHLLQSCPSKEKKGIHVTIH